MLISKQPEVRLPKTKISDPTQTRGLRKQYEDAFIGLFHRFKIRLNLGVSMNHQLNYDVTMDIRRFNDALEVASNNTIYVDAPGIVDKHIRLGYKAGKQRAISNPRLIQTRLVISPFMSRNDELAVTALKTRNLSLITNLTEETKTRLLNIMVDSIRDGTGSEETARLMTEEIDNLTRTRARTITRTEISYAYNTAISQTYRDAGIEQWQWLAALGTACCEECTENHGEIFEWSDPKPPLHPNCLCTIYPIVDKPFTP